jgi:hypothetical protein
VSIGKSTVPFVGLSTLGWLLFLVGQLALLANLILLLHRYGDRFRKSAVQFVTGVDAANAGVRS